MVGRGSLEQAISDWENAGVVNNATAAAIREHEQTSSWWRRWHPLPVNLAAAGLGAGLLLLLSEIMIVLDLGSVNWGTELAMATLGLAFLTSPWTVFAGRHVRIREAGFVSGSVIMVIALGSSEPVGAAWRLAAAVVAYALIWLAPIHASTELVLAGGWFIVVTEQVNNLLPNSFEPQVVSLVLFAALVAGTYWRMPEGAHRRVLLVLGATASIIMLFVAIAGLANGAVVAGLLELIAALAMGATAALTWQGRIDLPTRARALS